MPRILLIEDDQPLRRALRISLEKMGHEVGEADDGREGLALFKVHAFALVVTDIIMPGMEGMETIRALRLLRPHLHIIAISGGGRGSPDNYLHLARHLGAALVFEKPFEFTALCAAVATLLGENGVTARDGN